MNHIPRWAQAFNISDEQYTTWAASAAPGQPALAYALERGLVNAGRYLAWARDEFGLPSLDAEFFSGGVDLEMVRAARESESYGAWFYPVGRWDDVTFVACVEPVDGLPESFCHVLADARAMREAWDAAGLVANDAFTPAPRAHAPDHLTPAPPPEAEPEDDGPAMPPGLTAKPKPFYLNLKQLGLEPEDGDPVPPELVVVEAVAAEPVHPKPAPAAAVPVLDVIDGVDDDSVVEMADDAPAPNPIAVVAPTTVVTPARAPTPVAVVTPAAKPAASVRAGTPEMLDEIFASLDAAYGNACILRCVDQMVRLHKAGPKTKVTNAGPTVDLSYPSFLRIVARTKQPYHGYLIDSPTHRDFFAGLGLADLPASATAAPLMVDGALWGMLVVTGSTEQREGAALDPVVDAAARLAEAFGATWAKSAA